MLPVFQPLKDRAVLTVWSGLCTSTVGEDLFRVASVWLAVEVAGNMVGLVTGVQYVAMLVAGLFGPVLFDRWRPVQARGAEPAVNGLFGAPFRIGRLVGPMVAGLLHLFLPVIHFLTATALGF